jgi:hypothetical protein
MEATRLAPAGRACSKFVWQSRFLKNWAVRVLAQSGRPAFSDNHPSLHVDYESPEHAGVRSTLIDSIGAISWGASQTRSHSGCDSDPVARNALRLGAVIRTPVLRKDRGPASSAMGWPLCCRVWASLLAAEMRRTAGRPSGESIPSWVQRRSVRRSACGAELVSEFETKRDQ